MQTSGDTHQHKVLSSAISNTWKYDAGI